MPRCRGKSSNPLCCRPQATGVDSCTRVRWAETYNVDIAAVDRQHTELIETIHELELPLRAGKGNGCVNGVLKRLVNYADVRFSTEESLMQEPGFPGPSSHRAMGQYFQVFRSAPAGAVCSMCFTISGQ